VATGTGMCCKQRLQISTSLRIKTANNTIFFPVGFKPLHKESKLTLGPTELPS
jgi:hypothetical protein